MQEHKMACIYLQYVGFRFILQFLTGLAIFVSTCLLLISRKRYRWFYIICSTIGRDVRALIRFSRLNLRLMRYDMTEQTVPKIFARLVAEHPQKIAIHFEDENWTFQQIESYSNRIANFFKASGLKRGDVVALLLESRPEFICIWLGLSKIGVITALININLIAEPLVHSISIAKAKSLIYGSSYKQTIQEIQSQFSDTNYYEFCDDIRKSEVLEGSVDLKEVIDGYSAAAPLEDIAGGKFKDKLLYIYTSGTTGLPKAAVITNMRYILIALGIKYMFVLRNDDILYDSLPLYHSSGTIAGVGLCLIGGLTVVIRKKFSASAFWTDCIKYNCTVAQYIGEICRYILAVNSKKGNRSLKHSVQKLIGNGLRPQIWDKFVKQFNVPAIHEFYGSTEGNSNLMNIDGMFGAVGFIPRYATSVYPVALVKSSSDGEPVRDANGHCIRCGVDECGVLIAKVKRGSYTNDFVGYADEKANEKKLIRNAFKKGDLYFNSGDILVQDELGYFYFKDRTGDTFRWKGENVATAEIEAVISNLVDLSDAIVYGVEIPGNEGRAGMVSIVDINNTLEIEKLSAGLKQHLPAYAVPIFIRVLKSAPLTGTFKLQKSDLQKEGFDLDKIGSDKLYVYEPKCGLHVQLTKEKYDEIIAGEIRL